MKPLGILIEVEPVPKSVPRVRFVNGQVITYYSRKTTEALETIKVLIANMHLKPFPKHTPIKMEVTFWRTKSKWLPRRESMPFRKPDLDNFCKLAIDCISHTIVPDDAQITSLYAQKKWSDTETGYITIKLEVDKS